MPPARPLLLAAIDGKISNLLNEELTGFTDDIEQVRPLLHHLRMNLLDNRYPEEEQQAAFVREVTRRVESLPGVNSAGIALALPFSGMAATLGYRVWGIETPPDGRFLSEYQVVTPGYFHAMGIPLIAGRLFNEQDRADAPPVVIVNEAMLRRHWPGEDPIGKRISFGGAGPLRRPQRPLRVLPRFPQAHLHADIAPSARGRHQQLRLQEAEPGQSGSSTPDHRQPEPGLERELPR